MANKTDLGIKLTGDSKSLQAAIKQVESSLKNLQSLSLKFKDSFNLSGGNKLAESIQKSFSDIKIDKNLSKQLDDLFNINPKIEQSLSKTEKIYKNLFDKIELNNRKRLVKEEQDELKNIQKISLARKNAAVKDTEQKIKIDSDTSGFKKIANLSKFSIPEKLQAKSWVSFIQKATLLTIGEKLNFNEHSAFSESSKAIKYQ